MSNEIISQNVHTTAIMQARDITPHIITTATMISKIAWESGAFGSASEAQAAMVMLKAYELGFPMTAANEFLEVIDNRAQLKPLGAMAIMRAHPEVIRSVSVEDLTDEKGNYIGARCTIERNEAGRAIPYIKEFTLQDARTAGLIKEKGNWEKYPKQMCQWRAVGFCADLACPDLLSGMTGLMKRAEMMEDPNDIMYGEPVIEAVPAQEPEKGMPLSELISRHSIEDVMEINAGAMPKTDAECYELHEKLIALGK